MIQVLMSQDLCDTDTRTYLAAYASKFQYETFPDIYSAVPSCPKFQNLT